MDLRESGDDELRRTADQERVDELEAEALLRDARIEDLIREVHGLKTGRESAAVIEQAKGVLMHSMSIDADAAFAVLVAASQRENAKLRDVAARIVAAQKRDASP